MTVLLPNMKVPLHAARNNYSEEVLNPDLIIISA